MLDPVFPAAASAAGRCRSISSSGDLYGFLVYISIPVSCLVQVLVDVDPIDIQLLYLCHISPNQVQASSIVYSCFLALVWIITLIVLGTLAFASNHLFICSSFQTIPFLSYRHVATGLALLPTSRSLSRQDAPTRY